MDLKANWLKNRKQQLLAEISEVDSQAKELIDKLIAESSMYLKEINELKEQQIKGLNIHKQEMSEQGTRLKSLETMVVNKQNYITQLQLKNSEKESIIAKKTDEINNYMTRLLQLEHLNSKMEQQNAQCNKKNSQSLENLERKYSSAIEEISRKYQKQIEQREKVIKENFQSEIQNIKLENLKIIRKLEDNCSKQSHDLNQNQKNRQQQCSRLVAENTKLLASINQYKLKIVNLEGDLSNSHQQIRISQRQIEIIKQTNKRQLLFLKEERVSAQEKLKRQGDKIEHLEWKVRQNELKRDEENKKLNKEVDECLQEVIEKAKNENKKSQEMIHQLELQIQKNNLTIKALQQKQTQSEGTIEKLKAELKVEKEKEGLLKNNQGNSESLLQANGELKKQIIRKNCEIQVLQEEVKRLKSKVNKIANTQDEFLKNKEMLQKQNKMLLSEIIFLREKEKKTKKANLKDSKSRILSDINSEQSQQFEDVQTYKTIIKELDEGMNEALKKIRDKDVIIDKQRTMIEQMERLLNGRM